MSISATAQASRRFMLGVLAAMPALPTLFATASALAQNEPVASWNDGSAKEAILDFFSGGEPPSQTDRERQLRLEAFANRVVQTAE